MNEPTELVIGDTWNWSASLDAYPAGTWTLTYYFRSREGEFDVTCAALGNEHLAEVHAATSEGYKAGFYSWTAVVTDGTTRTTIARGATTVKPDPAQTGAGLDPRSVWQQQLEALEAVLGNVAKQEHLNYSIGGRSLEKMSREELIAHHREAMRHVANERDLKAIAAGHPNPRDVVMRFTRV